MHFGSLVEIGECCASDQRDEYDLGLVSPWPALAGTLSYQRYCTAISVQEMTIDVVWSLEIVRFILLVSVR